MFDFDALDDVEAAKQLKELETNSVADVDEVANCTGTPPTKHSTLDLNGVDTQELPRLCSEVGKSDHDQSPTQTLDFGASDASPIEDSARPEVGEYFETICRVMMREHESLKSNFLGYVPAQIAMVVLEVPSSKNSRRIHVCEEHGVKGWVSIAKESGDQLLKRRTATAAEKVLFNRLIHSKPKIDIAGAVVGKQASSLTCDKCDGPHATDCCPFFKKARDDHKDAWVNYGEHKLSQLGSDGGNYVLRHARVVPQPPDGSCLFHSLNFGLHKFSQGSASQLRRDIATFIESNVKLEIAGDTIEEWVRWDQNTSAEDYARRMAHAGWGGGVELACFSRMKRVNVHVYERSGAHYKRISCFDFPRAMQTVHVLYQGGMHYDALLPLT